MSRPVAVAVSVPRLEVDRPFTYLLPDGIEAPLGTAVSVPFHGRTVRGWVLGPTDDLPPRVLPVRRVLSRTPVFDHRGLRLFRWMSERYVVPLATAIDRAHPPRVASEEEPVGDAPGPGDLPVPDVARVLAGYPGGPELLSACGEGAGVFVVRPLPRDEAAACVEAVAACVARGRDAVVVVPEADPLPATAAAVMEAFGDRGVLYAGRDRRARYRTWLDILAGRYRVVVGTRPAAFALVRRLGLLWVSREAHAGHREERVPRHHVRDVALARGRLEEAVCVLAGLSPSAEAVGEADRGAATVVRPPRPVERAAGPLVETTRPEREDRSARLARLLREARTGVLLVSRRGYGVARVCRRCGEPARCAACHGPIAVRGGSAACAVCGAAGRCPSCGGTDFGVERGGTERVQEWASHVADVPITRVGEADRPRPPGRGILVGTAAAVKDFGPVRVELVAVLDPDRARRRAGLASPEQALATWFEAAAWAGPRGEGGRVLLQTADPADPAVQALVRWDPWHFHRHEARRRAEAGFPPGFPVFRVSGSASLPERLRDGSPVHLLASAVGEQTVCLVTVRPDAVPGFRARILSLVEDGVVDRVEAEPQL